MLIGTRGMRFVWILGFVLLLGTAVGAGWFFNQPATGKGPASSEPKDSVGLGYVDVQGSVVPLHPLQPGRVTLVLVKEGDEVRQGDLLVSVDNDLQRMRLREASADLDAARKELAQAQKLLAKNRDHDIAIQKNKIKALQYEQDIAQRDLDNYKGSATGVNKNLLANYEDKLKAAGAAIEAQEEVLKKLQDIDVITPIELLKDKIKAKQAVADQAQRAVFECDVYAPTDGAILRLCATPGETLASQPRQPAIQFCPNVPRIVRAEILQEWADNVQVGQVATIEDDTRAATRWKGKVIHVSDWFTHRRSILLEPFQYNDVRTLECLVSIDPGGPPVRLGQRVRVIIKANGN
jgi:multidrug resistance efflux pump